MADEDKAVIKMEVDSSGVRAGAIAGGKAITDEATKILAAQRAQEAQAKKEEYARRRAKMDAEAYSRTQQGVTASTRGMTAATREHIGAIAELGAEFIGVGGAIEIARRSIESWGTTDKTFRQMAVASGDSVKAIQAYGPVINELSRRTGLDVDKIAEAFDVLRDKSGKTFGNIVGKGLPAMVAATKGMNLPGQMNQIADVLGTAMNQFGLTEDQAMEFFDHIQAASDKLHLNLKELLPMLPQLMASMKKEGGGDGGMGSLDKMLATLAAVRYKGFGSTGEAAVAMQQRIENMTNSLADHGIGTQRQLLNSLEAFKATGRDSIDWLLGKLDEFEAKGGNVKEIFEQRQLKFITALKAGRSEIAPAVKGLSESAGLMEEAFNKMNAGFGATLDRIMARWNIGLTNVGRGAEFILDIWNQTTDIEKKRQEFGKGDTSASKEIDRRVDALNKQLEDFKKNGIGDDAPDPRHQVLPMKEGAHGHGGGHAGEHAPEEPAQEFPARRPLTSRGVREDDRNPLLHKQSYTDDEGGRQRSPLLQQINYSDDTDGSPRSLFRQMKSLDDTMSETNTLLQRASYSSADKPSGGGGYNLGGGGGGSSSSASYGGDSGNNQTSMPSTQPNAGRQRSASLAPGGGVDNSGDMPAASGPVSAVGGNAYLAEKRAGFRAELQDPATRKLLGAVIQTENPGAGPAVAESLMNRTELVNAARAKKGLPPLTLKDMMLGHPSIDKGKSFYGPVRSGAIRGGLGAMNNPKTAAARNKNIDDALGGSNVIDSYTDQGSAGDPNYAKGGVGVNINRERFNNWGYPGSAQWRANRKAEIEQAERNKSNTGMRGIGGEAARDRQQQPAPQPVPQRMPFRAPQPQAQQSPAEQDAAKVRQQMEEPVIIRTKLDTSDVGFRRASMRRELDREVRESRWNSFSDIGAA